jgi:hypothetical protein
MKNIKFLIISLFFTTLFINNTFAGFKKGNGGNVVVCKDYILSLDLYEGEFQNLFHYQKETIDWKDILVKKIERLSLVDDQRKELYKKWLADFELDSRLIDADLGVINDSLHVSIPEGCTVVQTVLQQLTPLPFQKRYIISFWIWNQLSHWDKAGLILHEFVYRDLQFEDSRNARYFTSWLFSEEFQEMSKVEIENKMFQLGF